MLRGMFVFVCVLAVVIMVPPARAPPGERDTLALDLLGDFHDLEIDPSRGRLYATDDPGFGGGSPPGVAVIDLATQAQVARINMSRTTGLALSPSGRRLAVGTSSGGLYLVDPDTLEVTDQGYFSNPPTSAYFWDLAFDGEDRLVASLGSFAITCEGSLLIVNVSSMSVEARLSEPPCGIWPFSSVRVDSAARRFYLLQSGTVSVYNLTAPFGKLLQRDNVDFTRSAALSPDGAWLYFSSGRAYDAPTLTVAMTTAATGEVAMDAGKRFVYYYERNHIDQVLLSDGSLVSRFAFRWVLVAGPAPVSTLVVDATNRVAYVLVPYASNANSLRAIALWPGFVDPYPGDGSLSPFPVAGPRVIASGIVNATVSFVVDGTPMAHDYVAADFDLYVALPTAWTGGTHHVSVSGRDASGEVHSLAWSFTIDTKPPSIYLDLPPDGFHTRSVTVSGRIVDDSFHHATVNGRPLIVDSVSGAFSFDIELEGNVTQVVIRARDLVGYENITTFFLRYVPPLPSIPIVVAAAVGGAIGLAAVALLIRFRRRGRPSAAPSQMPPAPPANRPPEAQRGPAWPPLPPGATGEPPPHEQPLREPTRPPGQV